MIRRAALASLLCGCGRLGFAELAVATGDGPSDLAGPDAAPMFVDAFDGSDATVLPNGWIQKRPNVFGIASQRVVRQDYTVDYRDNVVWRPAGEDLLDVEASVEFTPGHLPPGYPQVFVRLQQATLTTPNMLDGYILYIDGGTTSAKITRQVGTTLPPALATFVVSPGLQLATTYRLRLRATGSAPVLLDCYVEQQNGSTWTVIGHVATMDSAANAFVGAGSVGFSAGQPEATGYYTYDNFTRTAL
jgi:hypothetical protein